MTPGPDPSSAEDERWGELATKFLKLPEVTLGRAFSRNSLKVGGKLFAAAGHGSLLIKIGADRVAELIANGQGLPFSTGGDRVMREWVAATADADWIALAGESLTFVAGRAAAGSGV